MTPIRSAGPLLRHDRPMGLLAARHLLQAAGDEASPRRRPGRARAPWRRASARPPSCGKRRWMTGASLLAQRTQDEARRLEHRRRRHAVRGSSCQVSLPFAGGRDPLRLTPSVAAGSGLWSALDQMTRAHDCSRPKGDLWQPSHASLRRSMTLRHEAIGEVNSCAHARPRSTIVASAAFVARAGRRDTTTDLVGRFLRRPAAREVRNESLARRPGIANEIKEKSAAAVLDAA